MKAPDPAFFPWAFSQPNFAQIFPKHIYEGTDPRKNPANFKPVGTGPFKFKEWARGSHIVLERNPDYFHKDNVFLDRVVFQIIPDAGARQVALETRRCRPHPVFRAGAVGGRAAVARRAAPRSIDSVRPALGEIIMFFNLRHAPARQEGGAPGASRMRSTATCWSSSRSTAAAASRPARSAATTRRSTIRDVPKYPRDVAQRQRLLDQAGFRAGAAARASRCGSATKARARAARCRAAAEIMREQLREVGIDLQLQPVRSGRLGRQRLHQVGLRPDAWDRSAPAPIRRSA